MAQLTVCDRCGQPTVPDGAHGLRLTSPSLICEASPLVGNGTFVEPPRVFILTVDVKAEGPAGLSSVLDLCSACLVEVLRRAADLSGQPKVVA